VTVRRLLFALTLLVAFSPLAAHAQSGGIGIALTEAPTNRANDPRARVYIVDHVAPGTTIARKVKVSNSSDENLTIETYAAAATIKDGQFRFGDGHARNELTTWTTVDPSEVAYAAGESKLVTVTIAVPKDASEGERYGVVWASVSAAPTSGGITNVNRVGVRIYLSVGPGGEPPSDFRVTGIQARRAKTGEPQVVATVENTGGRALDLSGKLHLTKGPGGLRAGPFNVKLGTTLGVHQTEPVLVTLNKALPAGPWHARLDLESGLTQRHAEASITFPKKGSGPVEHPKGQAKADTLSLLIFILVFAALLFLFYGRRFMRRGEASST
jgi:WxL interacting protein linking bacterial and host surfaces